MKRILSAILFEDVTLFDAYSIFDMFGISMLEINDDDGLVATDIIHNTVSVEGASDSVDLPLSFDTMSGFFLPALMMFLMVIMT